MDLNLGIKNDLIDDDDLMNMKSVSFEESKRTNDIRGNWRYWIHQMENWLCLAGGIPKTTQTTILS